MKFTEEVFCTLAIEGIHNWPECPFERVAFLRDPHRHMFHIKAYMPVTHSDRDVEFILLKQKVKTYISNKYFEYTVGCCQFNSMSCEMIAKELIEELGLSAAEVSEDGENGSVVRVS